MNPIYSMTGFASIEGLAGETPGFTLTAKSVNHRFLDLQFRLPGGLDALEVRLRQQLKARLKRGHVDVTLAIERARGEGELRVNEDLLGSALAAFRASASKHRLLVEPDLNMLLRLPGMMAVEHASTSGSTDLLHAAVAQQAEDLIHGLMLSRAEEGASLAAELRAGMLRLRAKSAEVGALRAEVRDAQFERLRSRLSELLAGAGVSEERLLTEAAVLAERSDIEEENVRLLTHVERFLIILDEGGEVGKRLDFLLQELNREANTMLSKTGGAVGEKGLRITELGLEMKAEIERAREQVQNLE